jgi:hypothetical protein
VIKFCFDASRLRGLKREATLFQILKEELGDRDDIAKVRPNCSRAGHRQRWPMSTHSA